MRPFESQEGIEDFESDYSRIGWWKGPRATPEVRSFFVVSNGDEGRQVAPAFVMVGHGRPARVDFLLFPREFPTGAKKGTSLNLDAGRGAFVDRTIQGVTLVGVRRTMRRSSALGRISPGYVSARLGRVGDWRTAAGPKAVPQPQNPSCRCRPRCRRERPITAHALPDALHLGFPRRCAWVRGAKLRP